ncbi:DUF4762 family protein [Rahnella inusitata]|uniref:Uncharacterized protein n=1 Tax=Rahnella inusitata TaxID=58169 RepID=A0ABX9NZ87_9GAMM|nr:DUF4762 family protein [Rahnella inusitata]NMC24731.1 DUF4762 family protein [Serratia sp. (in: enterobacteria)]QUT17868.1 DUF4762 family protein [Rahnella inusitata]RJT10721.1 hypothetical protein D5396_18120 [Rahnella inusitata]
MIKLNMTEAKKVVGGDSRLDYQWQSVRGNCRAYYQELDKHGNVTKSTDMGIVSNRNCGH